MVKKAVLFTRERVITEKLFKELMGTQEEGWASCLFPLSQEVKV